MLGSERRPSPALREWIDGLWFWEGDRAVAACETALPSGSVDLVINLDADQMRFCTPDAPHTSLLPGAVVSDPQHRYFLIDTSRSARAIGVRFKPGRSVPYVRSPAAQLQNSWIAASDVWGSGVTSLRDRLLETSSPDEKFDLLEAFLLQQVQAQGSSVIEPSVLTEALRAFDDPDLLSVAAVRERVDLSASQLLTLFAEYVGLRPKTYWRIRRFRAALQLVEARAVRGAAIAVHTGYFDQAHLDREFRHFTGCSPRSYLAHHVGRPNHGPAHA